MMTSRPNIVFIVSDDQGYGDAGCYWDTEVDTPVMDSVACNGVRFTQLRVNPLCAPTRATFFVWAIQFGMRYVARTRAAW